MFSFPSKQLVGGGGDLGPQASPPFLPIATKTGINFTSSTTGQVVQLASEHKATLLKASAIGQSRQLNHPSAGGSFFKYDPQKSFA
jgi:hypothetical protein